MITTEAQDDKQEKERDAMIRALKVVSFYANINHGSKCDDYGRVVNPILKKLGIRTGEM